MTTIGRAMKDETLHQTRGVKFLDRQRRIDKRAAADILHVGVTQNLRKQLSEDHIGSRAGQLPSIHERCAAIVGVHETRDRGRESRGVAEASEIVEPDDDVLTCVVDGDGGFRLERARDKWRFAAVRLLHAAVRFNDAPLMNLIDALTLQLSTYQQTRVDGILVAGRHSDRCGERDEQRDW